jgi:hypothetical protein
VRTFVAFLVLYGNLVAPWLCCCTAACVASRDPQVCLPVNAVDSDCTSSCCHKTQTSPKPSSPRHPCPMLDDCCIEQPVATIERSELDIRILVTSLVVANPTGDIPVPASGFILKPAVGMVPTLPMAELRLKHHHALLC